MKTSKQPIKWTSILRVFLLIGLFALLIYSYKHFNMEIIKGYIQRNPYYSGIISLATYFITSFTFIPTSPLTVFLSLTQGPVIAIDLSSLGNITAAIAQYYIGTQSKVINNPVNQRNFKIPQFLRNLPMDSPLFLLAGRVIPGGTRGLSIICGFYHIPFMKFLWTTALMFLLNATFQALGGTELLKII